MILWCDGPHDATENMRRDSMLLGRAGAGERYHTPGVEAAVLRLFSFSPPGITLGRSQDPARELDLARCERDHVTWAVRPTGGRAIFHAEEWTYSLAAPLDDPYWGGSLQDVYGRLSRLLLDSLRSLGVAAAFVPASASPMPGPRGAKGAPAAPCFASSARLEIVLDNRKLVGSAQRRAARALLQQGSVLLGEGHLRLLDYLRLPDSERAEMRERLRAASTHAGNVVGKSAPLERWAEAIRPLLPAGAQQLHGDEGRFLLTPRSPGSYTRASA